MMHAAGFYHEQSRTDRNDWVYINFDNIQPGKMHSKLFGSKFILIHWEIHLNSGKENNFNFYDESVIQTLGAEYDYGTFISIINEQISMISR